MRPLKYILTILLAAALAACADNKPTDTQRSPQATATPAPTAPRPLLIWHSFTDADQEAFEQIRLDFEVEHPDIDVQLEYVDETVLLEQYTSAVNQGLGPDLLFAPAAWIPVLYEQGLIRPIDQEAFDRLTDLIPEPVARSVFMGDSPYGIPYTAEFPILYYNRVRIPTPPTTMEGVYEKAQLHQMVIPPTFVATSGYYLLYDQKLMDWAGQNLINPSTLEAYLADLQSLSQKTGVTFTLDQEPFKQGEIGMMLGSSADYPALQAALGENLGTARLPAIPPQQWPTLIRLWPAMQNINSTSQAVQDGNLFMNYLLSSEIQRRWFEQTQRTPVNTAGMDDNMLRTVWGQALSWGGGWPLPANFEDRMLPTLDQAVQAVTLNHEDPKTVAERTLSALAQ